MPSHDDNQAAQRLNSVGDILGIKVLDHIIIGGNRYHSFAESTSLDRNFKKTNVETPKKNPTPEDSARVCAGIVVKTLRLQLGMKQKDLSQKTGILQTYLSQIENGHKSISEDEAVKLSTAFSALKIGPQAFLVKVASPAGGQPH